MSASSMQLHHLILRDSSFVKPVKKNLNKKYDMINAFISSENGGMLMWKHYLKTMVHIQCAPQETNHATIYGE